MTETTPGLLTAEKSSPPLKLEGTGDSGWPPVSWEDPPRAIPLSVVTGSSRKVVPRDIATDGAKSGAPKGLLFRAPHP